MRWIEVCKTSKLPARTCKKLPVASFCASETAETGRIANGCEQGDHVSRRKGAKARAACCPDAPFVLLFQKQVKCSRKGTPNRRQGFNFVPAIPPHVCTESRFAKPRKFPKGNGFILFASTKRTKSSRRAAALSTPGDGSKLYRLYFFVTFLAFVPKQAYGATHFFGCFEPVRKGCCGADARLMFFENGRPHCKLTGASRIRKRQLLVIFAAVGIYFCGVLIKCLEISQGF